MGKKADKKAAKKAAKMEAKRLNPALRFPARTMPRMAFDGADLNRRTYGWNAVSTNSDAEYRMSGARLRDVSREMVRNKPYATRAKNAIVSNTIGGGIIPSIKADKAKRLKARLEDKLSEVADTTAIDADGKLDLYGMQALVMKCVFESGEAIVRMRPRTRFRDDKLPMPFQLQVLEPDYLDASIDGQLPNGNVAVQGIEFDKIGRAVAYHLFQQHPGANGFTVRTDSSAVPAEFIAHVYRVDRPGQARGIPWLHSVMMRLNDLHDFLDAQLIRQKIAACFVGFVTGEDSMTEIGDLESNTTDNGTVEEIFEPGMMRYLKNGQDVKFGVPPPVTDFESYLRGTLREIASGLGVSYEALTGDMSTVNFASGRMGWLEFQRNIDTWRSEMLIPQFCHRVARWFFDGAAIMGLVTPSDRVKMIWTPPRREMISPRDEVPYIGEAIRNGLTTRSEELRKRGYDPEKVDQENAEDNARADALGLKFDSDARYRSDAGLAISDEKPKTNDNGLTDGGSGGGDPQSSKTLN